MDEQTPPTPASPEPSLPPAPPVEAPAAASPYRPVTAAILIAAIIIGAALMGSALYVGDKLDLLRMKLSDIGAVADRQPRAAGEDVETPPAKIDPARLVSDNDPIRGPKNAKVTIVEFSDYQCPFCERFYQETLPSLLKLYGDKIRFVYKDFPLPMHGDAQKAHEAAHCAGDQGKYWEYHNKLFENRNSLGVASLKRYASDLGLNSGKFDQCLDSGQMAQMVKDDMKVARSVGVNGTPTFFINDQRLVGAQPIEAFQERIDELLK